MNPVSNKSAIFLSLIIVFSLLFPYDSISSEKATYFEYASITYPISSPYYPVVLTGKMLPTLLDDTISHISIYALHGKELKPIPFQIDRRDKKGRFLIPVKKKDINRTGKYPFDKNDECVFMAADLGEELNVLPDYLNPTSTTEVRITDPETGQHGWVYVLVFEGVPPEMSARDYISYNHEDDSIGSETYRIAFSKAKPFLVDTLQWREAGADRYSPDFADIMKIRHTGKLFHRFDFIRTQDDYTSKVVAIKDGPVRVIRRTANRVRIVWQLKTPAIDIDYICYGNGFFTDTLIEIPFKMSWFFSDVKTLMTLDGNDDLLLPQIQVFSRSVPQGLIIDGKMSEAKEAFNATGDKAFGVSSSFGKILVTMDLERNFPIQYSVYMMDDKSLLDPPEDIPGQFGNIGFFSTDWEKVDTSLHHMVFSVYMIRDIFVDQGFEILQRSPSFVN